MHSVTPGLYRDPMALRWGMSDKIGNIDYAEAHEGYQGNTAGFSMSTHTKEAVEQEVRRFIQDGYDLALKIITEKADEFERLARGLLEYETLTGDEISKVMAGEPLNRGDDSDGGTPASAASVTALPKTKARKPKVTGLEPEPTV